MKKKVWILALCIVAALVLMTACGGGSGSGDSDTPATPPAVDETTTPEATDEPAPADETATEAATDDAAASSEITVADLAGKDLVLGISTGSSGTSWRDIMIADMETVANEYKDAGVIKDFKIVNNTTNGDANEQQQIVRNFIDDPAVNIIMINPNDQSALDGVIAEAQTAGKLVVVYDAPVSAPKTLQVTLDHYAWALKNAEFVCSNLEKGNMIDVFGLDGHPANNLREQAFDDTLAKYPDIKVVGRQSGGWDQTQAKEVAAQFLGSGQQIDGVLTQDGMAYGCLTAFQDVDKLPKVMFGDPGTAFFKEWKKLRDEKADFKACAQANPPGIGATAMRLALNLAQGKTFKADVLDGTIYYYVVQKFYTDENFDEAWEVLKDKPDDYLLSEYISQEDADALFQ
jgi:ribose transport system substrate-binding protein